MSEIKKDKRKSAKSYEAKPLLPFSQFVFSPRNGESVVILAHDLEEAQEKYTKRYLTK